MQQTGCSPTVGEPPAIRGALLFSSTSKAALLAASRASRAATQWRLSRAPSSFMPGNASTSTDKYLKMPSGADRGSRDRVRKKTEALQS